MLFAAVFLTHISASSSSGLPSAFYHFISPKEDKTYDGSDDVAVYYWKMLNV